MMKKLRLNKKSIANLSKQELNQIMGGWKACWENLWTLYYCKVMCTGISNHPQ